jgi:hypothetical protein
MNERMSKEMVEWAANVSMFTRGGLALGRRRRQDLKPEGVHGLTRTRAVDPHCRVQLKTLLQPRTSVVTLADSLR